MLIHENGFWLNPSLEGHGFDTKLADAIVKYCKVKKINSIYDFGCGHGFYTKELLNNNILCVGYDGNPHTEELTNGLCKVMDLSKPFVLEKKDYVLCLEVGEHIPKQFEKNLIENIHNHNTKGIILSWAVIGQGGDGHVNCQNNDYIKNIFKELGYVNQEKEEKFLRNNSYFDWFKNTIMVFTKNGG